MSLSIANLTLDCADPQLVSKFCSEVMGPPLDCLQRSRRQRVLPIGPADSIALGQPTPRCFADFHQMRRHWWYARFNPAL